MNDQQQQYPYEDWLADCHWYFPENPRARDMEMDDLIEHFQASRKDADRADYCLNRFQAAMMFLEDNRLALDFGKAAVLGQESSLISSHVIKTLYRFFAGRPDHAIYLPIPIDVFIREVKSQIDHE